MGPFEPEVVIQGELGCLGFSVKGLELDPTMTLGLPVLLLGEDFKGKDGAFADGCFEEVEDVLCGGR